MKSIKHIILSFIIGVVCWKCIRESDIIVEAIQATYITDFLVFILESITFFFVSLLGYEVEVVGNVLRVSGTAGVKLVYGCLGVSHFALFFGLIILAPCKFLFKIIIIPLGFVYITILNAVRLTGVSLMLINYAEYGEEAHFYFTRIIIYSGIFILWLLFIRFFHNK